MAYDPVLMNRVRALVKQKRGISERRMFGGICLMVNGNMFCGVRGNEILIRLGNDGVLRALEEDHTRPMDLTGRVIKSMIYVEPEGLEGDELKRWIEKALRFARTLPEKR